jgi:imidazole glycerol phosphate synthase subunit HisF
MEKAQTIERVGRTCLVPVVVIGDEGRAADTARTLVAGGADIDTITSAPVQSRDLVKKIRT